MNYILCAVLGYCLGCFSTAYFMGRIHGFDIRDKGSGNAGASNVQIALGWKAGVITALVDILKGFAAAMIAEKLFPDMSLAPYIAGSMAVIGHIFPFYLGFKGGKGYATYVGMIFGLDWRLGIACVIWGVIITLVTGYTFFGTLTTVILVPICLWILKAETAAIILLAVLGVLMFYKHKINIQRLIRHEEISLWNSVKHRVK